MSKLGHTATELNPSLVQLACKSPYLKSVKGLRFTGEVKLEVDGGIVCCEKGEILFTDYGLSGIAAMQLSAHYARVGQKEKHRVEAVLDFVPDYTERELIALFKSRMENLEYVGFDNFMTGILQRRIFEIVLKSAGATPANCKDLPLDRALLERIIFNLKNFRLLVNGTKNFESSQVTSGGLLVSQFYLETLESKLHSRLYAAGELLDVDGPCGGYNLQWAWSSGRLAGLSAADSFLRDGGRL